MTPTPSSSPEPHSSSIRHSPSMNGFEKHAQTAIQVILVAITMWVGSAVIALRDSSIRLEEKSAQTRESLSDLKVELAALRILVTAMSEKNITLSQQLRDVELRLQTMEKQQRRRGES